MNKLLTTQNQSFTAGNWYNLQDKFLSRYKGCTQTAYQQGMKKFISFCRIQEDAPATKIPDEDVVRSFRDSMLESGLGPASVNIHLAGVRAFYRFLKKYIRAGLVNGNIDQNRAGYLQLLIEGVLEVECLALCKAHKKLPATADQAKRLVASIPTDTPVGSRDRAIISLLVGCGLRRVEITRACNGDLVCHAGRTMLRIQQKGHHEKDGWVVLWPEVEKIVCDWLKFTPSKKPWEPLFPALDRVNKGKFLSGRYVSKMVRKRLDEADLPGLTAHSLRHTFATIAVAGGADIRDVQHALGHNQVTTTERYVHQQDRLAGKPEFIVQGEVFH